MNIFEYLDYKVFLNGWIKSQKSGGHGMRAKLAEVMGCNTTYVTHVLKGNAHLSMEQIEKAALFLGLSQKEKIYLILLLQFCRAGTVSLRDLLKAQIEEAQKNHFYLKDKLTVNKTLNTEDQATYYSAWYYAAILVSLSVRGLQTNKDLAIYFGLSLSVVNRALEFLVSRGLAVQKNSLYTTGPVSIHLGSDSPNINKHHMNWRVQSIQALERDQGQDLHYSSVVAIAKEDREKVKSILVEAIKNIRQVVRDSKEDSVFVYTLDFFGLEKS